MTRTGKDIEISTRAKELIDTHLDASGRFSMLELMSGISVSQWKNFYYKKQLLNERMLTFLVKKYPHDEIWLLTGERPPAQAEFPFLAQIPRKSDCETLGKRFNWVIREFASSEGEMLFKYLQKFSKNSGMCIEINSNAWAKVILEEAEPTIEMVVAICQARPHFTEWVVRGYICALQVDPSEDNSVADWKAYHQKKMETIVKNFHEPKNIKNKEIKLD